MDYNPHFQGAFQPVIFHTGCRDIASALLLAKGRFGVCSPAHHRRSYKSRVSAPWELRLSGESNGSSPLDFSKKNLDYRTKMGDKIAYGVLAHLGPIKVTF